MLEASNLQSIYNVSPFLKTLVDLCYGDDDRQATKAYDMYVNVVNLII